MPVDVTCSSCQRKMRVPDTAAGKRIKCPKCQAAIAVPGGNGSAVQVGVAVEMWHLKTDDGQIYGPISRADLDLWQTEGRLNMDSQVLRAGSDQWQWASDLYPQLAGATTVVGPSGVQVGVAPGVAPANPFDFTGGSQQSLAPAAPSNPFDFGSDSGGTSPSSRSKNKNGRGVKRSGAVTAVAVVNYVFGGLQFASGVLVVVLGGTFAAMIAGAAQGDKELQEAGLAAGGVIGSIIIGVGVFIIIVSLPTLAAGYGIMQRREWGRLLTLVLGGLHGVMAIISLPIGLIYLAYAIYVYVVLLDKRYADEFSR